MLRYEFQTEIHVCDDSLIIIEIEVTGNVEPAALNPLPPPAGSPQHFQHREIISVRTFTNSPIGPAGYVRYSTLNASGRDVLESLFMPYVTEVDLDAEVMEACEIAIEKDSKDHA